MRFVSSLSTGLSIALLAVSLGYPLRAQDGTPVPSPAAVPGEMPAVERVIVTGPGPGGEGAPATPPPASPSPSATPSRQVTVQAADPSLEGSRVETLIFIRHGEKPPTDQGQLSAQGLNRALALPDVLIAKYGPAQFIFAPATTKKAASRGATVASEATFAYIRPLMTIEPTAIRLGLPVETKFAYDEIGGLQSELAAPAYQRAVVYVAWEHHYLDLLVKRLVGVFGGDAAEVPEWPPGDFDSIFVVRVRTEGGKRTATFTHEHEGLDGLSSEFPQVKAR